MNPGDGPSSPRDSGISVNDGPGEPEKSAPLALSSSDRRVGLAMSSDLRTSSVSRKMSWQFGPCVPINVSGHQHIRRPSVNMEPEPA